MIWQSKEEHQKQKAMNEQYRQIREEYKNKLAEYFVK